MSELDLREKKDNSVLFTQDLWSSIVEFCDHRTLFGSLSRLSQWHRKWMDDPQNNRVIRAVIHSSVKIPLIHSPHNPLLQECSAMWTQLIDTVFDWIRDQNSDMPPLLLSSLMNQLIHSSYSNENRAEKTREIQNEITEVQIRILKRIDNKFDEVSRRINAGTITYGEIIDRPHFIPFILQIISNPPLFQPHSEKMIPLHIPRQFHSTSQDTNDFILLNLNSRIRAMTVLAFILINIQHFTQMQCMLEMGLCEALMDCLRLIKNKDLLCKLIIPVIQATILRCSGMEVSLLMPGFVEYLFVNRKSLVNIMQKEITDLVPTYLPLCVLQRTLRSFDEQLRINVDDPYVWEEILSNLHYSLHFYDRPILNFFCMTFPNQRILFPSLNYIMRKSIKMDDDHSVLVIQQYLFDIIDYILNKTDLMVNVLVTANLPALYEFMAHLISISSDNSQKRDYCLFVSKVAFQSQKQTRALFNQPRLLSAVVDFAVRKSHFSKSAGLLLQRSMRKADLFGLKQLLNAGFIRAMVSRIQSDDSFDCAESAQSILNFLQSLEKAVIQKKLPSSVLDEAKQECIEMEIHDVMKKVDWRNPWLFDDLRKYLNHP